MDTMRIVGTMYLIALMTVLAVSPCLADEIIFKDQGGIQTGTVLDEDEDTVTIRFPRERIQSIVREQAGVSSAETTHDPESTSSRQLMLEEKFQRLQERIELLERKVGEDNKFRDLPAQGYPVKAAAHNQLLQEEMGSVEGVILWKGEPLENRDVMIVLENYTGFSWASVKTVFSGGKGNSSDQKITLSTRTDSQGRYVFEKIPPGQYRLYWMPDKETGWVHRMNEKPDFEVIAGKLSVLNIPEKR